MLMDLIVLSYSFVVEVMLNIYSEDLNCSFRRSYRAPSTIYVY